MLSEKLFLCVCVVIRFINTHTVSFYCETSFILASIHKKLLVMRKCEVDCGYDYSVVLAKREWNVDVRSYTVTSSLGSGVSFISFVTSTLSHSLSQAVDSILFLILTFAFLHFLLSLSFSLPSSCLLEQFFVPSHSRLASLVTVCVFLFFFSTVSRLLTVSFILVAVNFFYSRQNTLHTRKNRHLSVNSTGACIGGRARCKATHHNSLASLFRSFCRSLSLSLSLSLFRSSSNYLNQYAFHSSMCAFISCRRESTPQMTLVCLSWSGPRINGTICLTTIFTVASVLTAACCTLYTLVIHGLLFLLLLSPGHDGKIVPKDKLKLKETFSWSNGKHITRPGDRLSLKCVASGSPLPTITWTLDGHSIPETHRIQYGDYVRWVNITYHSVHVSIVIYLVSLCH